MAFKKGISGNPGGKTKYKIYSDALRVEVNRIDPNNPNRRKINALRLADFSSGDVVNCLLLTIRQDIECPRSRLIGAKTQVGVANPAIAEAVRRHMFICVGVVVKSEAELLEIVLALHAASRFARCLHGGQQQRNKHADDGNDDEQLDERKTMTTRGHRNTSYDRKRRTQPI